LAESGKLEQVDLFGDPVRRSDGKRGRPAHRWSVVNSNKIKLLLALGWCNQRIADAVCVSLPTLKKHYFSELKERTKQRARLDARRIELAFREAETGSVSAMRQLDRLVEQSDAMNAAAAFAADNPDQTPDALGKKEAARREASQITSGEVDGDWGADLTPGHAAIN